MRWSDCEAAWTRQALPAGSAAETAALAARFETTRERLAAARLVRDVLEGSAGPAVCLGFGILLLRTGRHGGPIALAILLVLAVSALSVRARRRARRARPGAEAPLLTKLEADIAALRRERRQLLTLQTWHLGPVLAALLLVPALLALRLVPFGPWFAPSLYLVLLALAWVLNRREVRRQIDPRLDELARLRQALAATAGP